MPVREQIVLEGVNKTDAAFRGVRNNLKGVEQSSKSLGNSFSTLQKTLVGIGAALGTGAFARGVIATRARFEDLRTSLTSVTGSAQAGGKAFDFITKFSTRTQFSVEDLSTAFIKLKAAGIEPTEELLTTFTDTAAITTDQVGSLEAVTDLFARTVGGGLGLEEIERLGDRGVPVLRILKEELNLSRDQISEFGKTAEGARKITEAFAKGIKEEFGGATENLLGNLNVQFSNLGIAFRTAQDQIGEGLSPAIKDLTNDLTSALESNEELFLSIGQALGTAINGTAAAVGFLAENFAILKALGMGAIGFAAAKAFMRLASAFRLASLGAARFSKAMRKNIIGLLVAAGVAIAEITGGLDKLFDMFSAPPDPADTMVQGIDRINNEFSKLKDSSEAAFQTLQDEGLNFVRGLTFEIDKLNNLLDIQQQLLRETEFGTDEYHKLSQQVEDTKTRIVELTEAQESFFEARSNVPPFDMGFIKAHPILVEQISLFEKLTRKSIEDYRKALKDLGDEKLFEKALTPTQKEKRALDQRLADLEEFKRRALITEEEFQRRKREIIFDSDRKIIDITKARRIKEFEMMGRTKDEAESLADFEQKTAAEKGAFAISEGKKTFEALGQFNERAFKAYKAFAIAEAVVSTYQGAAKALASFPPPFNFIAAAAVVAAGLANVATIRNQQYSGRQMGGPVGAGQTYMVGEAGPELFRAPAGGGMIDNKPGGGGVVINFNVEAIDGSSFQDTLAENRSAIISLVNEAVNDSGRRSII